MRIITKGKIPKEKTYQIVCKRCGTVFEAATSEMDYSPPFQRNEGFYSIDCPLCGEFCSVDREEGRERDE